MSATVSGRVGKPTGLLPSVAPHSRLAASRCDPSREVLRIQDAEGRGPYRPGFSHRWSDPNGYDCPPWWEELGLGMDEAHARCVLGYHWGCAFTSREQLEAWFNAKERRNLDRLGYRVAFIVPSIIAAETPRQIVIGTCAPLSSFRYARIESSAGRLAA